MYRGSLSRVLKTVCECLDLCYLFSPCRLRLIVRTHVLSIVHAMAVSYAHHAEWSFVYRCNRKSGAARRVLAARPAVTSRPLARGATSSCAQRNAQQHGAGVETTTVTSPHVRTSVFNLVSVTRCGNYVSLSYATSISAPVPAGDRVDALQYAPHASRWHAIVQARA